MFGRGEIAFFLFLCVFYQLNTQDKTLSVTPWWASAFTSTSLWFYVPFTASFFFPSWIFLALCIHQSLLSLAHPSMCCTFNLPAISFSASLHLSFLFNHHASIHQTVSVLIFFQLFISFIFQPPSHVLGSCIYSFSPQHLYLISPLSYFPHL